ncbi:MAG TPA: type II secretion system F family protein [Terracidiphilus sp.]|nr:type II secretion system F family protein [Terracidiphilus sp.]
MLLIIVFTFCGVFAAIALPLIASSLLPSKSERQALATLDSAIRAESNEVHELVIDLRKDETLSSIPWLNRKLRELELAPHVRRLLGQAAVDWSPGRLLAMTSALFVVPASLIIIKFGVLLPALGVGLLLGASPIGFLLFKRSRRFNKFEAGLPEALDLMVSALRAGHSLVAAMGLVARECSDPVGPEFRICFEEQNYGLEMKAALDNLTARVPLQDLRMVSTAIMIQKESGGNLAEVLDKTSNLIRERYRLKREIKTHTAQGRMTGWVLTLVPVFLGIAMYFANPKMMSVLWHRDIGIKLIWASAGLTVLGGFVINRIVDIDV